MAANTPTALDPRAQLLTKAIGLQEGGGAIDYNAKGGSGESGAYQWMPNTWSLQAKQVLGDPNAPMTPENQNQVAYSVVKGYLDQGLTPAQVASKWNSGRPDAYKDNAGTNSSGVAYDTGAYVKGVQNYAEKLWGQQPPQPQDLSGGIIPTANAAVPGQQPAQSTGPSVSGFVGNIASSAGNIIGGLGNAIMHPVKTVETALGTVAGGVEKAFGAENSDTQMFDNAVGYLKNRYGGNSIGDVIHHIGNTLYTDPVGAALDLSTVLDGAGAAIGAAGKLADISKVAELSKASDYISSVNGLIKTGTPEANALLRQPRTLTKISDALQTVSDKVNPIVGATNVASSVINKVADFVPQRILLSAAPQLKRAGTVDQALDHITFGSIDKNLAVSATTKQGYYNQILKSLEKAPIQVGPDFGEYLSSEIRQNYPNLGKTSEQIMSTLRKNAGNDAGLVDRLEEGTLTTPEAYRLKVALENNSYKVAIDNPMVKANKDLAAFTGSTIGDYLKEIAPDTTQLFDEYSKEINWYKALKHIKTSVANKSILSMRDLVAFGAGHVTGLGGPLGLVAEKILTSKTVQMNAAKAANIARKAIHAGSMVVQKVAPTASKVIDISNAGGSPQNP